MISLLLHYIDRAVPQVYKDQGEVSLRRARLVVTCTMVLVPALPAYMLIHFLQGTVWTMHAALVFWLAFALVPFFGLRRGLPLPFLGFWGGLALVGMQANVAIIMGTGRAGELVWAAMAPFVGMAIGGRRVAGGLLALALTVCVVVLTLQHGGWVHGPIDVNPRFGRELLMGMVVTVVLFLFGMVYDDASNAALAALRGSNDALVKEVHEHEATQVQLQKTYADLLRSARLAGMAEVATGVLHNIGNGLTSIKVSSDLLRTRKGDVEVAPALRRVGERLRSDTWSDTDRETLARYVDAVAARAERTHGEVLLELEQLSDRVDHVATVVSLQQEYTRAHAVVEPVLLGDVVREAALLAALDSAIDWTLDDSLDTIPSMLIERHKLVQIVVNVLTNARDAVSTCPVRQVVVRATVHDEERVDIEFHDSGIGLPKGDIEQIFRHGFTTKPKGNGFGLHVSALAAMELGGSLSACASLEIAGACFRLQLPLRGQGQSVPALRA